MVVLVFAGGVRGSFTHVNATVLLGRGRGRATGRQARRAVRRMEYLHRKRGTYEQRAATVGAGGRCLVAGSRGGFLAPSGD